MNASGGVRHSGRRARYLGALSVVAACAAFLAIPSGASAAYVKCGGKLYLNGRSDAGPRGVRYAVKCSHDILGYSIHVSKRIDYFTPDPVVLTPTGDAAESDHFVCEGPIPGEGFGCPGAMTAANHVVGFFATQGPRCGPTVQAWVTATLQQLDSHDEPFINITEPFKLQPPDGCPTASATAASAGPSLGLGSLSESSFWRPELI